VKPNDLFDERTAELLGFAWLSERLSPRSPYGARCFAQLAPFRPGDEEAAQDRAQRICAVAAEVKADRIAAVRIELEGLADVSSAVARASIEETLHDADFLELRRFCESVERIDELLGGSSLPEAENDATSAVLAALDVGRSGASEFYLADAFDAGLAAARTTLSQAQAELDAVRGRETARVAQALGRSEVGDEFIVMRADLRGPLPAGVRIVREAPTYLLAAIEHGEGFLAALGRRQQAFDAVAATEERVRSQLSAIVGRQAAGMNAAAVAIGKLDVVLAAVHFCQRYDCAAANVSREAALRFARARFLPIDNELTVAGRSFVPIDLDLAGTAVLTGPNMGGKSVSLQTCGFLALLVAFGVPVPAAGASIGLFARIAWLGLGGDAHTGGLLSSFAQELVALKALLSRDAERLLVLADEFARTTTPQEGRALVIALLERLRERNACALVATHLQGIPAAAAVRHFAVRGLREIARPPEVGDLSAALRELAEAMDYRIVEVDGDDIPRADAIALAELLGMDAAFVEAAYRALSQ
jgi:DNA mismatch repair ATPase MutS